MTEGQEPEDSSSAGIPLCVDLDGTLIRSDLLYEALARLSKGRVRPPDPGPPLALEGEGGLQERGREPGGARTFLAPLQRAPGRIPPRREEPRTAPRPRHRLRRPVGGAGGRAPRALRRGDGKRRRDEPQRRDEGARARGALRRPGIRLRGKRAGGPSRLEEGAARHRRERAARDRERPEAGWKSGGDVPVRSLDREDARRGDPDAPVGEESSRLHPDRHRPQASGRRRSSRRGLSRSRPSRSARRAFT